MGSRFRRLLLACCVLAAASAAVPAAPAAPAGEVLDGPVDRLRPGEYLWAPQLAPDGPVAIIVSVKAQKAFVYRNGVPIGVSTVSTGKKGHDTPTGIFTILQKDVDHRSNLYQNAPMPFMQRLTWDGIALHAGHLPGYPASHGCIRLPHAFAELLFGVTRIGLTVVITDQADVPEVAPDPGLLTPAEPDAHPVPTGFSWHPERSPAGPVSIVVSGRDRRMIVLRNGIEIGSSDILIDDPVTATAAFTLRARDAAGAHWLRLPLPGQPMGGGGELTDAERARAHLPDGFRERVASVLHPGATLLVTRETLRSAGTGRRLTVMTVSPP